MAHATSHDMAEYGNFQISMTCNGLARFNELQDIFMDMFERYVFAFFYDQLNNDDSSHNNENINGHVRYILNEYHPFIYNDLFESNMNFHDVLKHAINMYIHDESKRSFLCGTAHQQFYRICYQVSIGEREIPMYATEEEIRNA